MSLRQPRDCEWNVCEAIARAHGRSFYFASRTLGRNHRRAILAAYAYCRLADDIVDRAAGDRAKTEALLRLWEGELDRPTHPVSVAFSAVREQYGIPDQPLRELFGGLRADLTIDRYATWSDLRVYCHQVAGTVGLIVAPILGCRDAAALPQAAELGIAMQLTNILRDVGEDASLGRIYLPLDELARFGVKPDDLRTGNPGPEFPDLMRFQIGRARGLYAHALTATPALSSSGRLTTLVAAELYAGILDQIEANHFDVFSRRAVVTRAGKVRRSAIAAWRFLACAGRSGHGLDFSPAVASVVQSQPDRERPVL